MKQTITAIRAVGAEFIRRILRLVLIIGTIILVALLLLGGWLTTLSAWWWILEVIFICASLLFFAAIILVKIIVRGLTPPLSATQRQQVTSFVDKLERVAETLQTPKPVIIYYVVRDVITPKPGNFIETVTHDSKTLAPEFARLRKQF